MSIGGETHRFTVMRDTKKSFLWIVNILEKHRVPFVIIGGLSARIYGSPRPLNDIDIDIPVKYFDVILEDIKPYIIYGPDHYVDARWDEQAITLNHEGQEIDLCGGDTIKIRDRRTGEWRNMPTDFIHVEKMEVFGVVVPVIKKENLVAYKSMLDGEHQQVDIKAILWSQKF